MRKGNGFRRLGRRFSERISLQESLILAGPVCFFTAASWICALKPVFILLPFLLSLLEVPLLYRIRKGQLFRQQMNQECFFYMEQMIYSFRKHHKIQAALKDLSRISQGRLREEVVFALDLLGGEQNEENLYQISLRHMQETYKSPLLEMIHGFLIRVEEQGGACNHALSLLLVQIQSERRQKQEFQRKKKNVERKLFVTVFLSVFICMVMVRMLQSVPGVFHQPLYQWLTSIGLSFFSILYFVFSCVLSASSFEKAGKQINSSMIKQYYQSMNASGRGVMHWKIHRKIERALRREFPDWLFGMLLRLQTENVHSAIIHSLDEAPEVLAIFLYNLIQQIEMDPVTAKPFTDFLKEFNLPEIHTVMMQLFAVTELGREEIQSQIVVMLEQNQRLEEAAGELRTEDALAGIGMLAAVPMLFSVLLMVADMGMVLLSFIQQLRIS